MGFHIFSADNSGGGGGVELPDYSLTQIVYPRKWINEFPVKEISISYEIPAFNQSLIFLENIPSKGNSIILVPIEGNIFVFNDNLNLWTVWSNWGILKSGSDWNLRIINDTNASKFFSGTLKYSTMLLSENN